MNNAFDTHTGTRIFVAEREHGRLPVSVPTVGGMLGPYRICGEIGSGGMAAVYLARCEGRIGLHRFVALKCIRPANRGDPAFVDMLHDEARIASLISHPHVCSVLDSGESDGVHYLAMDFLSGQTLECLRPRLAGPVGELPGGITEARRAALIARLIADASEGIHAAHELTDADGTPLDVVHRDVSPQNLFVTYDGCVKVLDFGLVAASDQRHTTRQDVVKGKLSYIQPEVLKGARPDRRADVWGLGVVLWELLAGRRLFEGDSDAETLQLVSTAPIPSPSSARVGVPSVYDAIVAKALARVPAERYPTGRALGRALVQAIAEQGEGVSLADLADLMATVFPGAREAGWPMPEIAPAFAQHATPKPADAGRTTARLDTSRSALAVRVRGWEVRWPLAAAACTAAGVALGVALATALVPDRRDATALGPPPSSVAASIRAGDPVVLEAPAGASEPAVIDGVTFRLEVEPADPSEPGAVLVRLRRDRAARGGPVRRRSIDVLGAPRTRSGGRTRLRSATTATTEPPRSRGERGRSPPRDVGR